MVLPALSQWISDTSRRVLRSCVIIYTLLPCDGWGNLICYQASLKGWEPLHWNACGILGACRGVEGRIMVFLLWDIQPLAFCFCKLAYPCGTEMKLSLYYYTLGKRNRNKLKVIKWFACPAVNSIIIVHTPLISTFINPPCSFLGRACSWLLRLISC